MFYVDLFIILSLGFLSLVGLFGCLLFAADQLSITLPKQFHYPVPIVNNISIAQTRWGKLFGIPNWWLGVFFYALSLVVAMFSFVPVVPPSLIVMAIIGAMIATLTSATLLYAEFAVLKVKCAACRFIHLANLGILGIWVTTAVLLSYSSLS